MREVPKAHFLLRALSTKNKALFKAVTLYLRMGKVPHYNTISGASRRASEAVSGS